MSESSRYPSHGSAQPAIPDRFRDAPHAANPDMIEWDNVGMNVVGFIRGSKIVNGAKGPYRVVTLDTPAGPRAIVAGAILTDLLADIPADSEVCITYLGFQGQAKNFEVRYLPPTRKA